MYRPHQPRPTPCSHPSPRTLTAPRRTLAARRPVTHVARAHPGGGDARIVVKPPEGGACRVPTGHSLLLPRTLVPPGPSLGWRGVLGGRGGHLEASCGPPTPDIRAPCPAQPCPSRCPSPGSPSQLPLTRPGQALGPSDWRPGGQEGPWMPATRCCGAQREKRPGIGGMPETGGPGTAHPPPKPGSEVRAAPQWSAHGLWGQDLGRAHMPRGYPEGSDRMPAGW